MSIIENMMLDKKNRVAIVGSGYMAKEHIKVFKSMPGIKVVGIHSRTRSGAKLVATQFNIPIVADTIIELYKKTKPDILIIAVSEMSVLDVAKQAFQYPWLLIIEKPAGYNYENALLIKDVAYKYDARVFVSFNRRYYNSTRLVLEQLEQHNGQRLIQVYDQEEPFLLDRPKEVHENWMYANSIHVIDYFQILGRGDIVDIEQVVRWNPNNTSFVVAKIGYSSGDIGIYTAVWNAPGPWAAIVTTKDMRWELKPLEKAFIQSKGSRRLESLAEHRWDSEFKPGLRMQAEQILKAVNGGEHTLVSLDESLKTMQLVKDIYEV